MNIANNTNAVKLLKVGFRVADDEHKLRTIEAMSTRPVSLKGHYQTCPRVDPKARVGGPVDDPGQGYVAVNGVLVGVVTGTCTCEAHFPDAIVGGSQFYLSTRRVPNAIHAWQGEL